MDVLMFVISGVVILMWPIRRSLCGGSVDVVVRSCAVSSDSSMMVSGVVVIKLEDIVRSGSLTASLTAMGGCGADSAVLPRIMVGVSSIASA